MEKKYTIPELLTGWLIGDGKAILVREGYVVVVKDHVSAYRAAQKIGKMLRITPTLRSAAIKLRSRTSGVCIAGDSLLDDRELEEWLNGLPGEPMCGSEPGGIGLHYYFDWEGRPVVIDPE
jgi:hypothetical protein